MKTLKIKKILLVTLALTGIFSCKKEFDQKPGTQLDVSQMYRDVYDANAAVMGIYGKFAGLADRYVILNELRGDLLEYTGNADEYLRQISTHSVTPDNPYVNPRPFYELILDCNDVLKHFDIMRQNNALKEVDYTQRYSDILCLRSFLYLQLGIHYGEVPYITEALESVTDVNDPTRFPKLKLSVLIDTLVNSTEKIAFKEIYPVDVSNGVGTSLNITLDAYPTQRFFINKKCFLGDLYLWKGDYRKAATYYRDVMEISTPQTGTENGYAQYKLGWSGGANLYVSYGRTGDASTLLYTDGWASMFLASDERFNREVIWALPFDSKFRPTDPLINLFSPVGGSYLVKPSQTIFDNWAAQRQGTMQVNSGLAIGTAGLPFDARGPLSTRTINGQPVVMKYLYNYLNPATGFSPINPLAKNGKWFLYRQAHLHLRYAEAANLDGFPKLAYALYNNGIPVVYDVSTIPDKTNLMNTFSYPDPYKFDARNGEIPRYRSSWYRNIGIRARVGLLNYPLTATTVTDSITQNEVGILNEAALETAFEGNRWPDLLRFAMRRNDPSIVADKVYQKLTKDGVANAAQVRDKLLKRDWFLPFRLQ